MQVYGLKKTNTRNTLAKAMEESCVALLVPLESTTATLDCVLGWPKSPFSFSRKIKDTFFIYTNNFIDLDILSMSVLSCYWLLVGRDQGAAKHLPMHKTAPQQRIMWPKCQ